MGVDPDAAAPVIDLTASRRPSSDVLAVFAVLWAAATLFHVWGPSGRAFELFSEVTTIGVLHALAGAVAIAVLLRPRSIALLAALSALGPATLWFEAPFLGSHWVVAALVDVAFLLALVTARSADRLEATFVPLARWVLIGFYAFAAFAKLNHAFFTPEVSCGTFYLDEVAGSLGITLHSTTAGGWAHLVPFGVAGTELSIPILLSMRRTRHLGVVVGLVFHSLIALDQTHLFSDFSSVLVALFVLFLPREFAGSVIGLYRERVRIGAAAVCGLLLVVQWKQGSTRLFRDGLGWVWVIVDVTLLVLVVRFLLRSRPAPIERPLSFARTGVPRWMAIVPLLVLLTGLSPYLELRTAYAFNMYSNLQTVDGDSNHFLVTRSVPLTDFQSDPVRILASSDSGLQLYADGHFDVPLLQLRDFLSRHQNVSLTYVRGGVQRHVDRADEDPALVEPVPSWESKLFAFRSIDQTDPARCQPSFLPAL
ncbi:MAG: hypothetical protein QOC92_363 [Acidimicrobiaceae bacterium]|jgi:hypothetical protein